MACQWFDARLLLCCMVTTAGGVRERKAAVCRGEGCGAPAGACKAVPEPAQWVGRSHQRSQQHRLPSEDAGQGLGAAAGADGAVGEQSSRQLAVKALALSHPDAQMLVEAVEEAGV